MFPVLWLSVTVLKKIITQHKRGDKLVRMKSWVSSQIRLSFLDDK